ncbi:hypothetical protein DFH08DRAFT_964500 [Mycena albidolilacea]|uniref:Uncharacterized protein n=1 Tax=Mycena albidolilacea TaxID=1033008 RepID=A0AAD6ZSX3_9AGAR|nr:hypothetical protein DFH08DRAFT_964500 [Mycena albidolilacea]
MSSLLVNTDSHLTDKRLRSHLESVLCRDLLDDYRADPITKAIATTKLSLWLHEMKHIDNACLRSYNQMKAAIKEVEHKLNKRLAPTGDSGGSTKCPRSKGPSNSSAGNNTTKRCLPLTEEEKKILDANQGCCLPFQMTHRSSDKMCPFPRPICKENTPAAAAIIVNTHVVAVLPNINNLNDSSGTSDGDLSRGNMSFPHKIPHFFWKFLMDGPVVDFPVPVRGLIDDGSHLVLITPEIVDHNR